LGSHSAKSRQEFGGVRTVICPGKQHFANLLDSSRPARGLIHTEEVTGSIPVSPTQAGHRLAQAFRLPPASKLLLILALVAALAGLVLATRRGRRFAKTRLLPGLRSAAVTLRTVAASPVKLTLLTGGSALITLAYIGGLVASVRAFGGRAGIAEIGAVYLGAAVIAAASPTPGGLGAIEAALVAGLTGIGVPPGPAVSAVLAYRLATYWLPVLPGWLCLRFLQNRQYI